MVSGRAGFALEGWKFGIYLGIPILASWWYGDPERQKAAADYWRYVQYPANPNTNMKEKFLEQRKKYEEQRAVYSEQLKQLDKMAKVDKDEHQNKGFWSKLAFWRKEE